MLIGDLLPGDKIKLKIDCNCSFCRENNGKTLTVIEMIGYGIDGCVLVVISENSQRRAYITDIEIEKFEVVELCEDN